MQIDFHGEIIMKLKFRSLIVLLALVLSVSACGGGAAKKSEGDGWQIVLTHKKEQHVFRLAVMNVYVTDPVAAADYPEAFEIFGENIHLVGTFPMDKRVGYQSNFDELLNVPITIKMQMINARDYKIDNGFSTIALPELGRKHVKGQIVFRERTGESTGRDGDITLIGEISVEVGTGKDKKTLTGTISVHPVAWG